MQFLLFSLLWLALLYLLNCLIAGKIKHIEPKFAILYFCITAMVGLFGEIFLDTLYNRIFGTPLWRYNIAPIHHAYTSSFAIVTWGIYGFHLYLLHGTLKTKSITKTWHLAVIISLEALILEAALTLSAKWLLGDYLYYYYPSNLWHVTAWQNIPFYLIFGFVIVGILHRVRSHPWFFSGVALWLTVIIAFFTTG